MVHHKGYEIEKAMMKWFRGKIHSSECVDFQTKTSLYEVKSCNLFNRCGNGNYKRVYSKRPHKQVETNQHGRFYFIIGNHKGLEETAKKENKMPKYIFVIIIGKQKIWRVKSWEFVDSLLNKNKKGRAVLIKDVFYS